MSDLQTIINILSNAHIQFKVDSISEHTLLTVEAGYIGFKSVMTFSPSSNLLSIEAYE